MTHYANTPFAMPAASLIWVPVQALVTLLVIQIPANLPTQAVVEGTSAWAPDTCVRDPHGIQAPGFELG